MFQKSDITIFGGTIYGERVGHVGTTGEWGHGISIWGGKNIRLLYTNIYDCWGDCIYIAANTTLAGTFSEDVKIVGCTIKRGRRQGISVVAGKRIKITDSFIADISGTAPESGIDLEPNDVNYPNQDILIDDTTINNCQLGMAISKSKNVKVVNSTIHGVLQSVQLNSDLTDIVFDNDHIFSDTRVGAGGMVILGTVIDGLTITNTTFDGRAGGGDFLLDGLVPTVTGGVIENNKFYCDVASQPRAVRLDMQGRFKNNTIEYRSAGGINSDYFIQVKNMELGGNTYRNSTANAMYSLLTGSTLVGTDNYVNTNLTEGSLSGRSGLVQNHSLSGTAFSAGYADGATWTAAVTGFVGTDYDIAVNVYGGGGAALVYAVSRGAVTPSGTGFSIAVTNNGGATQDLHLEWTAARKK